MKCNDVYVQTDGKLVQCCQEYLHAGLHEAGEEQWGDGIAPRTSCWYCGRVDDNGRVCAEANYGDGQLCTREPGHPGPHVSCGITTHPITIWSGSTMIYNRYMTREVISYEAPDEDTDLIIL